MDYTSEKAHESTVKTTKATPPPDSKTIREKNAFLQPYFVLILLGGLIVILLIVMLSYVIRERRVIIRSESTLGRALARLPLFSFGTQQSSFGVRQSASRRVSFGWDDFPLTNLGHFTGGGGGGGGDGDDGGNPLATSSAAAAASATTSDSPASTSTLAATSGASRPTWRNRSETLETTLSEESVDGSRETAADATREGEKREVESKGGANAAGDTEMEVQVEADVVVHNENWAFLGDAANKVGKPRERDDGAKDEKAEKEKSKGVAAGSRGADPVRVPMLFLSSTEDAITPVEDAVATTAV